MLLNSQWLLICLTKTFRGINIFSVTVYTKTLELTIFLFLKFCQLFFVKDQGIVIKMLENLRLKSTLLIKMICGAGSSLERVQRVHLHPSISSNGC